MFCNKCGAKLEEGQLFCGNCGNKVTENAAPAANNTSSAASAAQTPNTTQAPQSNGWFGGKVNNQFTQTVDTYVNKATNAATNKVASMGGELADRRAASLGWKQLLAGALFALIVILYYFPVLELNIPEAKYTGYYDYEIVWHDIGVSLGNPLGDFFHEIDDAGATAFNAIFVIFIFIIDIGLIVWAALYTVLPVFRRRVLVKRSMIFPIIIAARAMLGVITWNLLTDWILDMGLTDSDKRFYEMYDVDPANTTFWSVLMVVVAISLIITLVVIRIENHKYIGDARIVVNQ